MAVGDEETVVENLWEKYRDLSYLCRWGRQKGKNICQEEELGISRLWLSIGNIKKLEKYREKMNPIFDEAFNLFTKNNPKTGTRWNSKKECANFFIRNFYKNNPNTDIDLDAKKIVQEITNRLNNLYEIGRQNYLDSMRQREACGSGV